MRKRPSPNAKDACCRCGLIYATPLDPDNPAGEELRIHQPDPTQVAQWMCYVCVGELQEEIDAQLEPRSDT